MAPLAPSKLSATGFTYPTTPTRVCVGGLSGGDVAFCDESACVCVHGCVCVWMSVGVRQKARPQTSRQKWWGGPTVSDELCVFSVMACRWWMGELQVLHSHSHLLIKLAWRGWPTLASKTCVFRCVSVPPRASTDRYRHHNMWVHRTLRSGTQPC